MFHLDIEIPDLYAELRELVGQVPRGWVTTYGDLAGALGDWRAARWVSEALADVERLGTCPDHRIVRATGELGQYGRGDADEKAHALADEGVPVSEGMVELGPRRFADFQSARPLAQLAAYQKRLHQRVVLKPLDEVPEYVAGVDVSYPAGGRSVAAYVLVEMATGRLEWSTTVSLPVPFPYITGYLTFRELPVLLAAANAAESAGKLARVVLVDGSGILHPRGAGIAANFGVVTGLPSIGVSKTLLSGQVDLEGFAVGETRPIVQRGETRGVAMKSKARAHPVFVSPGSGIDVDSAARLVQRLFHGHRLPEPTHLADALSRQAGRDAARGADRT